jgi:hypothetical protein
MTVTRLEPVAARGGQALDLTTGSPLVVRGHYGFGRVTVVGLNVDQRPFVDWADRHQFWVRVLDLRHRGAGPAPRRPARRAGASPTTPTRSPTWRPSSTRSSSGSAA